jgi:uncharacterized protein (TIGR04255 family)
VFDLPDAPSYHLAQAPLAQALVQVRHPVVAHLSTTAGISELQERFKSRLPYMTPYSSQIALQITPLGVSPQPGTPDGWEFSSDDGHRLVISPGATSLVADSQYRNAAVFADLFCFAMQTLESVEGLRRCDRIGVRYLSIATPPPENERMWAEWFRPELTGWPVSSINASRLDAAITRTQLTGSTTGGFADFPAEPQAVIASGWYPTGTLISGIPPVSPPQSSFVLDLDLFVTSPQPFSADILTSQFRALHGQIDRFFYWSLSERGREYFGLEVSE